MQEALIVDATGGARFIGCSERTFHDLRKRPDFPRPLKLFPTRPRWRVAELRAWVDAVPAADDSIPEPERLRLARDARGGAR